MFAGTRFGEKLTAGLFYKEKSYVKKCLRGFSALLAAGAASLQPLSPAGTHAQGEEKTCGKRWMWGVSQLCSLTGF